jgi:hypothetical protein
MQFNEESIVLYLGGSEDVTDFSPGRNLRRSDDMSGKMDIKK